MGHSSTLPMQKISTIVMFDRSDIQSDSFTKDRFSIIIQADKSGIQKKSLSILATYSPDKNKSRRLAKDRSSLDYFSQKIF